MLTVANRLLLGVLWLSPLGCREENPEFISDETLADSGSGEADTAGQSESGESDSDEGSSDGCWGSECGEPCVPPLLACDEVCVDLKVDTANCGECGLACGPEQSCEQGLCKCEDKKTACLGGCFDTDDDDHHCGDCMTVCAIGTHCDDGICD